MPSYNRVELIGRLGRDPIVRFPTEGEAGETHARLSVATDRPSRPGTPRGAQTETDWHHVSCWGRLAEFAGRYLSRGRLVLVTGRLQYGAFEGRGGETRRTVEIVATEIVPLDPRPDPDPETGAEPETAAADTPAPSHARAPHRTER